MKKVLLVIGILAALCGTAKASEGGYTVGYSSYAAVGVRCTSGTVVQMNPSRPTGFTANVAGYTLTISSGLFTGAGDTVFIGGPSVSTAVVIGATHTNFGAFLAPGNSKNIWLGKKLYNAGSEAGQLIPFYCKASDTAGTDGVVVSVEWWGY